MSIKLAIFKTLSAAALAATGAALAQKSGNTGRRKTKGGCTPCATNAAFAKAHAAVRTGKF
mgnify:CR=1 FL=1